MSPVINTSAMDRLINAEIRSRIYLVADLTAKDARRLAPQDTGRTKSAIAIKQPLSGSREVLHFDVGAFGVFYGVWVHQGTGVYNGRGLIRPKRAYYMHFYWKKLGRNVAFAHVKGQPSKPYLLLALDAMSPWPVRVLHRPGQRA